jgi:hypothetical protein
MDEKTEDELARDVVSIATASKIASFSMMNR